MAPSLPRGCVPYLPCPVDALLRLVEHARGAGVADVFVDVGSGLGRAAALVHLLTGARAIGLEIQPRAGRGGARDMTARLRLPDVSFVEGDAVKRRAALAAGSVFLLYCPFSGDRLAQCSLARAGRAHADRSASAASTFRCPPCDWLTPMSPPAPDLTIYRSNLT